MQSTGLDLFGPVRFFGIGCGVGWKGDIADRVNPVEYEEDGTGRILDPSEIWKGAPEPYLPFHMVITTSDEIAVESSTCEACNDKGWVQCNIGNDQSPQLQIQRCDACELFESDEAAQAVAQFDSMI